MNKLTMAQVVEKFQNYNKEHNISYGSTTRVKPLKAVIVYKESNFDKPYSLEERSYRIQSDYGKRFFSEMFGSSVFGTSLDGSDRNVRLDYYKWDVDYCYFEEDKTN